jgi:hypothetical protein
VGEWVFRGEDLLRCRKDIRPVGDKEISNVLANKFFWGIGEGLSYICRSGLGGASILMGF